MFYFIVCFTLLKYVYDVFGIVIFNVGR